MKKFTLFWRDGKSEVIQGDNIHHAILIAGYGRHTLGALDFYGDGDMPEEWAFDAPNEQWYRKNWDFTISQYTLPAHKDSTLITTDRYIISDNGMPGQLWIQDAISGEGGNFNKSAFSDFIDKLFFEKF